MEDWDAAEKANQEARALKPDPGSIPALQLNQAAIATGRGRTEEARLIYEQTIASNAVNPGVLWQAHAGLAASRFGLRRLGTGAASHSRPGFASWNRAGLN